MLQEDQNKSINVSFLCRWVYANTGWSRVLLYHSFFFLHLIRFSASFSLRNKRTIRAIIHRFFGFLSLCLFESYRSIIFYTPRLKYNIYIDSISYNNNLFIHVYIYATFVTLSKVHTVNVTLHRCIHCDKQRVKASRGKFYRVIISIIITLTVQYRERKVNGGSFKKKANTLPLLKVKQCSAKWIFKYITFNVNGIT